jgi:hypothetical protein
MRVPNGRKTTATARIITLLPVARAWSAVGTSCYFSSLNTITIHLSTGTWLLYLRGANFVCMLSLPRGSASHNLVTHASTIWLQSRWHKQSCTDTSLNRPIFLILYICILSHIATSLSLFFPSFVRFIDVFNTLLVFLTLCHFLTLKL